MIKVYLLNSAILLIAILALLAPGLVVCQLLKAVCS